MKILAVDDKLENRYLLEILLKGNGFEVETAENGVEALDKLRLGKFDLIISDILMPEMDGYQLCRQCQRDKKLSEILFVFYTATYTEDNDEELAMKLGADRFIRKPVEPDRFIQIIREVISKGVTRRKVKRLLIKQEAEVFKLYNHSLVKKLEKKMLELEISENKYRTIFDNTNDGLYLHEVDAAGYPGRILEVNAKACEMLGYTKEEFKKMKPQDFDDQRSLVNLREIMKILEEKGQVTFLQYHKAKDGKVVPVEISTHIFELNEKKLVLSVVRDISARLQAEKAASLADANWKQLFNVMDEILLVVDAEGNIYDMNLKGMLILGKSIEDIIGQKFTLFFHNEENAAGVCLQKSVRTQLICYNEFFEPVRDRYFSIKCTPIRNKENDLSKFLIAVEDISFRKKAELELVKHRKNLEDLVAERTESLQKKNEELERVLKLFDNREFRIKELREEVKELRAKLGIETT